MNKTLSLKTRKMIFFLFLTINFICIFIYNYMTPLLSDDLLQLNMTYDSVFGFVKAEWSNYMSWNSRFFPQLIMRAFMCVPKSVFNVLNSFCFIYLILLIYWNIDARKKYDFVMFGLTSLFVWLFSVSFGQTVLWESGACNYLWSACIILSMVSLYRYKCKNTATIKHSTMLAVGMFVLGVISGWCNENTSGGAFLVLLYTYITYRMTHKKKEKRRPWMLTGLLGMLVGIGFMVMSPGAKARSVQVAAEERHFGVMRYLARFLQINLCVEKYLFLFVGIVVIIVGLKIYQGKKFYEIESPIVFVLGGLCTCYALILTPTPMDRAYFGATIFAMIAALQAIALIDKTEMVLYTFKYTGTIILTLYFFFVYCECGADLMRIKIFLAERDAYVQEQKAMGNKNLTVMEINPEFENDYTFAVYSDVKDDSEEFANQIYKIYYGLDSLMGTPFVEPEDSVETE